MVTLDSSSDCTSESIADSSSWYLTRLGGGESFFARLTLLVTFFVVTSCFFLSSDSESREDFSSSPFGLESLPRCSCLQCSFLSAAVLNFLLQVPHLVDGHGLILC